MASPIRCESPRGYMPTTPRGGVSPTRREVKGDGLQSRGLSETLLARWQSKLATNHPELNWMNLLGPKNSEQGDNHMAELALGFRVKETVLVDTEEKTGRTATVQVHYDARDGH